MSALDFKARVDALFILFVIVRFSKYMYTNVISQLTFQFDKCVNIWVLLSGRKMILIGAFLYFLPFLVTKIELTKMKTPFNVYVLVWKRSLTFHIFVCFYKSKMETFESPQL